MPMTFSTCISAQDFGLASETMIPGFQASQLSCAAPAQVVPVDPCHVFDESFLQDLVLWWTWPDTRIPLYIAGPTGCGKTTSVLQFLARVHVPVISLTCSRRFVKDDLVGRWGAHEGGFAWIDGPATIAWKTGAVLLINEFSLAPPEVWVGANDIFEGQSITIEKTGLSIPRHVNTRVIVTDNCRCGTLPESAYSSRNQQDASTCDRFWHMAADWPKPEVEARIVLYRCERIAQGTLSSETLAELARCAARFAQASRTCLGSGFRERRRACGTEYTRCDSPVRNTDAAACGFLQPRAVSVASRPACHRQCTQRPRVSDALGNGGISLRPVA